MGALRPSFLSLRQLQKEEPSMKKLTTRQIALNGVAAGLYAVRIVMAA